MERRKFLGLGLAAAALVPASLSAVDFRKEKPAAWDAHTVDDAIAALYGAKPTDSKKIKIKSPKIASNGGSIPVGIKTKLDAKSVALFQDANPESAVAVWTVNEGTIADYFCKIKMAKTGQITVVVETQDGKLYSASKRMQVALGGCEG